MTFPLEIPVPVRQALPAGTGVLLGLSGGVDSALTLAILSELGCDVQCVTFKNFCYAEAADALTDQACCSLEAIDDARATARRFGAVHWVADVSEPFRLAVIDPFVAEYAAARTPNPCLACNGEVRFPELVRLAERQGCRYAATGHYARIEGAGPQARLLRGLDRAKDQSYFLHRLGHGLLDRLVFPLGWATKPQVRAAAAALGLGAAAKRDSQEICFVPDGDRSFLFGGTAPEGDIVDRQGRRLGRHRGLIHYTVGQRRGLGVAAAAPLYVLELDRAENRLVVGARAELAVGALGADRFVPAVPDLPAAGPAPGETVTARIRHRHPGVRVRRWQRQGERLDVELDEPVLGAAPGQGLALYAGETVLGGGRILTAATWKGSQACDDS